MAKLNQSAIAKMYSDESEARRFLESILWKGGVVCPHCHSDNVKYLEPRNGFRKTRKGKETYRRVWQCANKECGQQFSVLVGTIFEDSHIPLSKWLLAIHEMNAAKNGVSALELQRKLGIAYRSAWFMGHRIRHAIARPPLVDKLNGVVEADETYLGGKAKNMHKSKREKVIRGRGTIGKTAVISVLQRGGEVRSESVDRVDDITVRVPLKENVDKQAVLMTDTNAVYNEIGKEFAGHETVDHGKEEYVRGRAHVNTAEGYFSQLKRSINGTYHHVSEKHLPRYLAEFDYRYSTRKSEDGDRTLRAIEQTRGRRLMYRKPIGE